MTHKYCFLILFISLFSFSQEQDSLFNVLNSAYQNAKTEALKIKTTLNLSEYHVDKDFSESKRLLHEAFMLLEKPENKTLKSEKAMAFSVQGIIDRRLGDYTNSIENYMKSKALYEALKDSVNISSLLHNVGMVHRYIKEYRTSIDYYKKAIQLKSLMHNQTYEIACSYNMMGVSYKNLKKEDSALWCYRKAITFFKEINIEEDIYRVKTNMAVLYASRKKYKEALSFYQEGLFYYKRNGLEVSMANSYYNISSLYKRMKMYELSMSYADSSLVIARNEGLNDNRVKGLLRKSFLYSKFDNYKEAYNYYRRFNRASDSIHNIENIKKIQALELNYEYEKEKREIQLLADNEATKKQLYFILFVVVLLLSIIIALLLNRDFKHKKRLLELENKELIDENEKISSALEQLKNSANDEERIKAKQEILKLKILMEDDWNHFRNKFELLYPNFITLLKTSGFQFTKSENRLVILKKLGLGTKEIANMTGVSNDSVLKTKYRLRKKLGISKDINIINNLGQTSEN
jgi:tetratricopeptide (TPR) repeat protein